MRGEGNHVDRASIAVWKILPEGKSLPPCQRLTATHGVFHVEASKAADVIANGVRVRPGRLHRHAVGVAKDGMGSNRLGSVSGGAHVKQRAVEKGRAANVAHAFAQHALVRHDLRFVFG